MNRQDVAAALDQAYRAGYNSVMKTAQANASLTKQAWPSLFGSRAKGVGQDVGNTRAISPEVRRMQRAVAAGNNTGGAAADSPMADADNERQDYLNRRMGNEQLINRDNRVASSLLEGATGLGQHVSDLGKRTAAGVGQLGGLFDDVGNAIGSQGKALGRQAARNVGQTAAELKGLGQDVVGAVGSQVQYGAQKGQQLVNKGLDNARRTGTEAAGLFDDVGNAIGSQGKALSRQAARNAGQTAAELKGLGQDVGNAIGSQTRYGLQRGQQIANNVGASVNRAYQGGKQVLNNATADARSGYRYGNPTSDLQVGPGSRVPGVQSLRNKTVSPPVSNNPLLDKSVNDTLGQLTRSH